MNWLISLYGKSRQSVRKLIIRYILKKEKGELFSRTIRKILKKYHDVDVGMYSFGGCFIPGVYGRFTKIGRYCSIANTSRAMTRNHPLDYKSTHAFFYNPVLGVVQEDTVDFSPLEIGSDVWIGHNVIIMPSVTKIGHGAVLLEGSVVNKDIPPYAIVIGNPARLSNYRFSPEIIERLLLEKWWEKDYDEVVKN